MKHAYSILYSELSKKKRKIYYDGRLHCSENSVILKDSDGKELSKMKFQSFAIGEEYTIGRYTVQIEELIVQDTPKKPDDESIVSIRNEISSKAFKNPSRSKDAVSTFKANVTSAAIEIDQSHICLLKPYQLVAVQFIIEAMKGRSSNPSFHSAISASFFSSREDPAATSIRSNEEFDDADIWEDPDAIDMQPRQSISVAPDSHSVFTGVILADEMGLGKTFTAIAAAWAFVRKGRCRALIVCPSSLVDNWLKEVKHWLNIKVERLLVLSSSAGGVSDKATSVIQSFINADIQRSPFLIASYEMFRKHAQALNQVPKLELLICDEAHRLKNVDGSKTMTALSECRAKKRLLLTGTPIQNDLDELYSLVSFVAPGFFGTLQEYKNAISGPIASAQAEGLHISQLEVDPAILSGARKGDDEGDGVVTASEEDENDKKPDPRPHSTCHSPSRVHRRARRAAAALRDLLPQIVLRRTQAQTLELTLPPKMLCTIFCVLGKEQLGIYKESASQLLRNLGVSCGLLSRFSSPHDLLTSLAASVNTDTSATGAADLVEEVEEAEEATTGYRSMWSMSAVLPNLLRLRLICNRSDGAATTSDANVDYGPSSSSSSAGQVILSDGGGWTGEHTRAGSVSGGGAKENSLAASNKRCFFGQQQQLVSKQLTEPVDRVKSIKLTDLLAQSSKLMLLEKMLGALRQLCPNEKVVVVANFTSALDDVARLADIKGWGYYRLDGSVQVSSRQSMVDCFNRSSDPRFLFLLSAKAGGVGLNLIGASRLFMIDTDWNPAIDLQAMARIWRQGQRKPCFIYRLVAHGCIEDAVLQRQNYKSELAVLLDEDDAAPRSSSSSRNARAQPLTARDVTSLVAPRPSRCVGLNTVVASSQSHDPVLKTLLSDSAAAQV